MKREWPFILFVLGSSALLIAALVISFMMDRERTSSFVGYSQSCWQVGDTLHVVTAKGDTVRLDVSKLNQK